MPWADPFSESAYIAEFLYCLTVKMTGHRSSCYNFWVWHWNLNSNTAHSFAKIDILQGYNNTSLSKSYLDASVSSGNENLNTNGYKSVIANHPENVKRGGGYGYFKESLSVRCLPNSYLKNVLKFKFLLRITEAMLFHCNGHLVKFLMNLTHLSLILKNCSWYI